MHTRSVCTGTQRKSSDFIGAWARPTCCSWRVSWGGGGSYGSLWGQGHWWWRYWGVLIGMSSPGGHHFDTKTWLHPIACRLQCWDTSGQTTNRVGKEPHPSADRLPKIFRSPQPSLNTPLDTALPTRGIRPSSTHKGTDTRSKRSYNKRSWKTEW